MPTRTVSFVKSGQEVARLDFWFVDEEDFQNSIRNERKRLGVSKKGVHIV